MVNILCFFSGFQVLLHENFKDAYVIINLEGHYTNCTFDSQSCLSGEWGRIEILRRSLEVQKK